MTMIDNLSMRESLLFIALSSALFFVCFFHGLFDCEQKSYIVRKQCCICKNIATVEYKEKINDKESLKINLCVQHSPYYWDKIEYKKDEIHEND